MGHCPLVARCLPSCFLWYRYGRNSARQLVYDLCRSARTYRTGVARCILAAGEAGNFPCANKTISAYFPQKDRAFATSLFNSGSQIGAMLAPFTIPVIARFWGWEMSFLIIGLLGFVWLGIWLKTYEAPDNNKRMNKLELDYIRQDENKSESETKPTEEPKEKVNIFKYFTYRHTWAIFASRFLPEGVWWFFLFWAPAYVKDIYGYSSDSFMGMMLIFTLYLITMLSIIGGYLPTFLVNKKGLTPFGGRISSMFVYSLFPLLGIVAPFLGVHSCWYPIIIIGIIGAAHQSWSANAYSLVSDLLPHLQALPEWSVVLEASFSTSVQVSCSHIHARAICLSSVSKESRQAI